MLPLDSVGRKVNIMLCDRTDCVRVFTDDQQDTLLDIQFGGWMNQELALLIDGKQSPPIFQRCSLRGTAGYQGQLELLEGETSEQDRLHWT